MRIARFHLVKIMMIGTKATVPRIQAIAQLSGGVVLPGPPTRQRSPEKSQTPNRVKYAATRETINQSNLAVMINLILHKLFEEID